MPWSRARNYFPIWHGYVVDIVLIVMKNFMEVVGMKMDGWRSDLWAEHGKLRNKTSRHVQKFTRPKIQPLARHLGPLTIGHRPARDKCCLMEVDGRYGFTIKARQQAQIWRFLPTIWYHRIGKDKDQIMKGQKTCFIDGKTGQFPVPIVLPVSLCFRTQKGGANTSLFWPSRYTFWELLG